MIGANEVGNLGRGEKGKEEERRERQWDYCQLAPVFEITAVDNFASVAV